ncbi:holliday junction resolvase [Indivirus ILV1]|uniref:Holliday junction resolvase n=1 Tax=Indivirus ILV1 TaxID=1977633 RepID=A0A1V0SCG2_9VIRU|nr:holliday junction resolvase [Indivirus ILV1]
MNICSVDNINILAWDVGIKHLALCHIKKHIKTNKFTIEQWINIDLTDNQNFKCGEHKKNNEICGASAKYLTERDKITKYYCKTHMVNSDFDIEEFEKKCVNDCQDSSSKCMFIKNTKKECSTKAKCMIDNVPYCTIHKKSILNQKIKNISIKPLKKSSCMNTDPQILCNALYKKLDELTFLKDINEVYIENQPAFKNPTMKTVSTMLFSYFVYLSLKNKLDMKVKFVSPTYKIALTKDLETFANQYISDHDKIKKEQCKCRICKLNDNLKNNKEKLSYDAIKELGIVYTKKILQDNNMIDKFKLLENCDKKDDLCDAFLHGYRKL